MSQSAISQLSQDLVDLAKYARMEGVTLSIASDSRRTDSISAPEFEQLKRELTKYVPNVRLLYAVR